MNTTEVIKYYTAYNITYTYSRILIRAMVNKVWLLMLRMYEPSVLLQNSVNQELHVILRFMRNTAFKIFLVTLTSIKRDSHSKDHSKIKNSFIFINIITKANLVLVIF